MITYIKDKQTEKILIENYYGKEIIFLKTVLKDGKITTEENKQKVWQPADKKMISPASGCDIIIHGSSCNTENIFEFGGIHLNAAYFTLKSWGSITLFNWCKADEVEEVKLLHKVAIKGLLTKYNTEMKELIAEQKKLLLSL